MGAEPSSPDHDPHLVESWGGWGSKQQPLLTKLLHGIKNGSLLNQLHPDIPFPQIQPKLIVESTRAKCIPCQVKPHVHAQNTKVYLSKEGSASMCVHAIP